MFKTVRVGLPNTEHANKNSIYTLNNIDLQLIDYLNTILYYNNNIKVEYNYILHKIQESTGNT